MPASSYALITRYDLSSDSKLLFGILETALQDLRSGEAFDKATALGYLAEDGFALVEALTDGQYRGSDMLDSVFSQFDVTSLMEINSAIARVLKRAGAYAVDTPELVERARAKLAEAEV